MTILEIKELNDKELVLKIFDILKINNLNELSDKIEVPYNTMSKWTCIKGIPTELPDRGGYRQLLQTLLFSAYQELELNEYRNHFESTLSIMNKYHKGK